MIRSLFAALLVLLLHQVHAQKLLDREISIEVSDVTTYQFLNQLSIQEAVRFAYNPADLPLDSTFTLQVQSTAMKQLLGAVFPGKFIFKEYKDHILFLKRRAEKKRKEEKIVRGYLVNVETGEFISTASISEIGALNATLSREDGFYEIELPDEYDSYGLVVSKYGFQDTVIVVDRNVEVIDIQLKPLAVSGLETSVVSGKKTVQIVTPEENRIHAQNYVSPFYRYAQLSFLPFLGTNLGLSGVVSNSVSINILAGYSFSTTGVELGGLVNIDRKGMFGFQAAGLANITGGKVGGAQFAGLANINTGITEGFQAAGLYNNATGSFSGVQFAGLVNVAAAGGNGFQLAGIANVSANSRAGLQAAGIHNQGDTTYFQASGITNFSNSNSGLQVGLLNMTKEFKGMQIGLINISVEPDGVPIGLFSYSRYGYRSLDIVFDETLFSTLRFNTGVNQFYNIYQMSWDPFRDVKAFGFGFGTRWNFGKPGFEVDATINHVDEGQEVSELNMLFRLGALFRYSLGKVQLAAGPEFKLLSSQWKNENGEFQTSIAPYTIEEWVYNDTFFQSWVGGNISVKFILHE